MNCDSKVMPRSNAQTVLRHLRVKPLLAWLVGMIAWVALAAPLRGSHPAPTPDTLALNDITRLNPITVARVARPRSVSQVRELMHEWPGPVAVGGGRYSMGGQTACTGCLVLDMRELDHVLSLDVAHKRVRVETGITWRKVQEAIDPHDLSVSIMQSFSNFTVGGSLSVNAHGRYVGSGPIIHSVEDIELVLADGTLLRASPTENAALFYAAIGGYGAVGVIVTATLVLADNVALVRHTEAMPVTAYDSFFFEHVRANQDAVFHHADLYPPDYDFVRAQTWSATDRPLTEEARLIAPVPLSFVERAFLYWVTKMPFGKAVRRDVYDPIMLHDEPVVLRNYEASHDVMELEPRSRLESTYALQEYFVPVAKLQPFVAQLRALLVQHDANVLNISIRHARPDPGSLLAWAREEVFSLVIYYEQGTDEQAQKRVGVWTRAAIDAALSVGGTYYLPYQPHANLTQLRRAYPRFDELVALKRQVDPTHRFRNAMWDRYMPRDHAGTPPNAD